MLKEDLAGFTIERFEAKLPSENRQEALATVAKFKAAMEGVVDTEEIASVSRRFRAEMIALYPGDLSALMKLSLVFALLEAYGARVVVTRSALARIAKPGQA